MSEAEVLPEGGGAPLPPKRPTIIRPAQGDLTHSVTHFSNLRPSSGVGKIRTGKLNDRFIVILSTLYHRCIIHNVHEIEEKNKQNKRAMD